MTTGVLASTDKVLQDLGPVTYSVSVLLATPALCSPPGTRPAQRLCTCCFSSLRGSSSRCTPPPHQPSPVPIFDTESPTPGISPSSPSDVLSIRLLYLLISVFSLLPECKLREDRGCFLFCPLLCPQDAGPCLAQNGHPLLFVSECRSAGRGAEPRVYSHLLAPGVSDSVLFHGGEWWSFLIFMGFWEDVQTFGNGVKVGVESPELGVK